MALQLFDLLARGYFPRELPPPFTTSEFAAALAGNGDSAPSCFADSKKKASNFSHSARHNLVRAGGLRRDLGIPNPVHYYRLAQHVVMNWDSLKTHAHRSPISLTKPVETASDRAISPEHPLSERPTHRARLRSTGRYLLKTDIVRFYPSIYTHSVPWALMGKAAAKSKLRDKKLNETWEGLLDVHSQRLNSNQTIGLPIGPDTSLLLAECILACIDIDLCSKFKGLRGSRYIDDYEFTTESRSDAEAVRSYLQHLLSQFELAVNPAKTSITELPSELESRWIVECRDFVFRRGPARTQYFDLESYFGLLFRMFRDDPDEAKLKYGIGRLRSIEVQRDNWEFFEDLLAQCVTIEPASIPQVCEQIVHYKSRRMPCRKALWLSVLNRIVCERMPLGLASECAWAMWLMKVLKVRLHARSAKIVSEADDSIAALMALGLANLGLAKTEHLKALQRFRGSSELWESNWLLCYQGNLMDWLGPGGRERLRADVAFQYLSEKGVSFFDIGVAPPPPARTPVLLGSDEGGGY